MNPHSALHLNALEVITIFNISILTYLTASRKENFLLKIELKMQTNLINFQKMSLDATCDHHICNVVYYCLKRLYCCVLPTVVIYYL